MPPAFVLSQDQTLHHFFLVRSFPSLFLACFSCFLSSLLNQLVLFVRFVSNCSIFKEPASRRRPLYYHLLPYLVNTFFLLFFFFSSLLFCTSFSLVFSSWDFLYGFIDSLVGLSTDNAAYLTSFSTFCQYLFCIFFILFSTFFNLTSSAPFIWRYLPFFQPIIHVFS